MSTAYDVARRAGVSIGTVSRYLTGNGYVGEASRAKIAAAIAELGYIPNRAAASLTTKNTGLIGFVVSDLRNPFTAEIASSLSRHARTHGYGLVLSDAMNDPDVSIEAVERMRTHGVDGLIVTPPESPALNDALVAAAAGLPVVGIGLRTEPRVTDLVTADTHTGALTAVQYLLSLGHCRIGYVGSHSMASGRYRGYLDAINGAGLTVDPELVLMGDLSRAAGFAALDALLATTDPPTAVFTANDALALGVIQSAHQRGVPVPDGLSVIGYDDIDLAAHSVPPLTTVAQPLADMGQVAVELIVNRRQQATQHPPEEIVLPVHLIIRESTASPG